MLELKKITKNYITGDSLVEALKGIDISFRESEFVSILGQSGCGKTTLLNIIGGLDRYTTGDLIINGKSTKEFNDRTKNDVGLIIPVVITIYEDKSFTFITKTPPAAVLIKKACGIESGSGVPNKTKVAKISKEQVQKIAEQKMPDWNAASLETAISMVAGTARSMGIEVVE